MLLRAKACQFHRRCRLFLTVCGPSPRVRHQGKSQLTNIPTKRHRRSINHGGTTAECASTTSNGEKTKRLPPRHWFILPPIRRNPSGADLRSSPKNFGPPLPRQRRRKTASSGLQPSSNTTPSRGIGRDRVCPLVPPSSDGWWSPHYRPLFPTQSGRRLRRSFAVQRRTPLAPGSRPLRTPARRKPSR